MPAFALPDSLGERLGELAASVRRQRLLRGGAAFVALSVAIPAIAIALDARLDLPGGIRGTLSVGWILIAGLAAWWFVVRRYRETISAEELARIVEREFPSLAERVRTLVGLSKHADGGNGSGTMMAILARETDRRTKKLDFHRAAPPGRAWRIAAMSALAATASLAPFILVDGNGERIRRFVQPWRTAAVEPAFAIVVSSGDPVVKRGQPITVSGYLKKLHPTESLPHSAAVLFRDRGSREIKKLPMLGDDKSAFTLTRPRIDGDLEYCLEADAVRSEWHTIQAVDSVEVAATETIITAPDYAVAARPQLILSGLADFDALQHSVAEIRLKFNRPAVDVQVEWRPLNVTAVTVRRILHLHEGNTTAFAEIPLETDGILKWTLFAEKDVRTEYAQVVRVAIDAKPKFERVDGLPLPMREMRPGELLNLRIVATDDLAITKLDFEYGPADGSDETLVRQPLALPGLGTPRVDGQALVRIPGATDGLNYRVRLVAADNRSIPELGWKPQTATYPDGGWSILRFSANARPFAEQDIGERRDSIERQLLAIRRLLQKAHADVKTLRPMFRGRAKLELDESIRFSADRALVQDAREKLDSVAADCAGRSELHAVEKLARKLCEGDARGADAQLTKTLTEANPPTRDGAALAAEQHLEAALANLNTLVTSAATALEQSLEIARLKQLAEDQSRLADTPSKSAEEQKRIAAELANLAQTSETLKAGKSAEQVIHRRESAERLAKLAAEQMELDKVIGNSNSAATPEQLDELAVKQKALAERVRALAVKSDLPTRIAQTKALDCKLADRAADALKNKLPIDALTEQEKTARELDRFADELEKSSGERGDVRKATQQLARWQDDLARRATDGLKQSPRTDSSADREKWAVEQNAIRRTIERLPLPPSPGHDKTKLNARDATVAAAQQLTCDPAAAPEALKKATEAIQQLADKTPTAGQRSQVAVADLHKLRKDLESIQNATEEAKRTAKSTDEPALQRKRGDVADKTDELIKKISAIDAAAHTLRRDQAAHELKQSADGIRRGETDDALARQKEAKDQLDRLKEALEGHIPADEAATELDRLQKELTEKLPAKTKPEADELQRLQRRQSDIARKLQQMQAPNHAAELQAARDAAKDAEASLKSPDAENEEVRKKSQKAGAATEKLAKKLNPNGPTAPAATPELAEQLPSEKQAGEARTLARDQRELREQLGRIAEASQPIKPTMGDPLKERAEEQRQLAAEIEKWPGENKAAAKLARAAVNKLDRGDASGAKADTDAAAELLKKSGADELARKQVEIARAAEADAKNPGQRMSRQMGKQKEIQKSTEEFAEELGPGESADQLRDAARAMSDAQKQLGKGRSGNAAESRKHAAQALDKLERDLASKSPMGLPNPKSDAARDAAQATREAGDLMKQAQCELGHSSKLDAGFTMNRAAEKLRRAAGSLGEAYRSESKQTGEQGGDPGANPGPPDKPATTTDAPSVVMENLGKPWGELPGEVKTRITQELKAKHGADYARLIELYFEQLAKRK